MIFEHQEYALNTRLAEAPPLRELGGWDRAEMTISCRDADGIPKVAGAGGVFTGSNGTRYQRMHNGVKVTAGSYHGEWMSEIVRRLKGHHEPQEETLFDYALRSLAPGGRRPVMLELGAFWAYYSLWFRQVFPQGRNILIEPDPNSLQVGLANFALNGREAEWRLSMAAAAAGNEMFVAESDGGARETETTSVDKLLEEFGVPFLDILHCDVQGAEFVVLQGASKSISQGRIGWLFLSTHHHTISNDPLIHQRCLQHLADCGAEIVAEHSVVESFSGDGLIAARFGERLATAPPTISRNVPSRSLFRELEYDLAQAWSEIDKLRAQLNSLPT